MIKQKAVEPELVKENLFVYKPPKEGHQYVVCVDVAQGRGQDYSTFNIIDVSSTPFEQVCVFRDNDISPLLLPDIIYKYANMYNKAYVIVESNDHGAVVCNGLYYELEYENMFVESTVKANAIGVKMTKRVKRIGCSGIKDLVEQSKLRIYDAETIIEMSTFVARGTSYMAVPPNHDDLMMNLVLFAWFTTTDIFEGMTKINIKTHLYKERLKAIQDDMLPFGFIEDGSKAPEVDEDGNIWFEQEWKQNAKI